MLKPIRLLLQNGRSKHRTISRKIEATRFLQIDFWWQQRQTEIARKRFQMGPKLYVLGSQRSWCHRENRTHIKMAWRGEFYFWVKFKVDGPSGRSMTVERAKMGDYGLNWTVGESGRLERQMGRSSRLKVDRPTSVKWPSTLNHDHFFLA